MQLSDNFHQSEFECACGCGAAHISRELVRRLQIARDVVRRALRINSGVRCGLHNARVGGAPLSSHLRGEGVDISTEGHDRGFLLEALRLAGFTGFGFYQTFIHVDMGRARHWFGGKKSEAIWQAIF